MKLLQLDTNYYRFPDGCKTPPNFTQHFDGDNNGKCDDCGYVTNNPKE